MNRTPWLTFSLPLLLAACGDESAPNDAGALVDTPQALLALAPDDVRGALETAYRHVIVVRHAQRDPECGDISCPLTPEGEAAVARLGLLLEGPRFDAAYASAACRTAATAHAAGVRPVVYRVVDELTEGCAALDLEPGDYTRTQAQTDVTASPVPWTLIADHSNFVCEWPAALGADLLDVCLSGTIEETNYGDIFWLYQPAEGAGWGIVHLVDAFATDEPATQARGGAP